MALSKGKKIGLYFFVGFFLFFSLLAILQNLYAEKNTAPKKEAINSSNNKQFPKKWKYTLGDDIKYAQPLFNDSTWKTINPELNLDSVPNEIFNGIIWFRCWFGVDDSLTKKTLAVNFYHLGASEIYIDGNLLYKFGKVSAIAPQEIGRIPDVPVFFSLADTNKHLLAIKYSNHKAVEYRDKYQEYIGGITIKFITNIKNAIKGKTLDPQATFFFMLLFGFLLTLSFVHFLLYLFYRKQKENLYYSLFTFIYSLLWVQFIYGQLIHNPKGFLMVDYYGMQFLYLLLPALVACLYSLFQPNHIKTTAIIGVILAVIALTTLHFELLQEYNGFFLMVLVIYTCIESVRSIATGFKRKQDGVKIVGTGVLVFIAAIFLVIAAMIVLQGNFNINVSGWKGLVLFSLGIIVLLSVPISMSIYLARNFAITNKNLHNKLIEVEQLSKKTIQQEKEKQQILATQNELLENKVTERTTEVVEQKRIVEEKQKEIIDSISYAKRLQQAILPPQKFLDEHFPDNFILYKPKDIVAGDFYWSEIVNNLFFLAAADSTGHGVPGAMVSVVCSNALNRAVKEFQLIETGKILDKTRQLVIETFEKSNAEVKDGMDISFLCIDKKNKKVFWSGANNPLWYIQNNELIEIKADKQPVGKSYNATSFTTNEVEYKEGTTFYLFTDGFADQFGGPNGKKFKYKQFENLLVSISDKPMHEQFKIIAHKFDEWKGGLDQVDDVCVMGVKI